jgi:hypothetical protein
MDLAAVHKEYITRMLDAAKGGMKALVCDEVTVREFVIYTEKFVEFLTSSSRNSTRTSRGRRLTRGFNDAAIHSECGDVAK